MKSISPFMIILFSLQSAPAEMIPYSKQWDMKLESLPPDQVLTRLDLDHPGLEKVKAAADDGQQGRALAELLQYYRGKYPAPSEKTRASRKTIGTADRICNHIFQWGPYEPADYGADIDWTIDPADDIEWVAAVYRFYWADDLTRAYLATRDDKYARAFVELTTDWIAKHPLENWTQTHPTLTRWKGFAWLDLQTGIRASKAVNAFQAMLHSEAVTPEFLAVFLASMYDHQHKTELIPMGRVHNKAIFEQRGVLNVCCAFPEFSDTRRWAELALERAGENLLLQTTTEGVQREWCGSYHLAVLNDGLDMMSAADELGVTIPDDFRERVHKMCDYLFAMATPDLAWPMFGDTARAYPSPEKREKSQLYSFLLRFSDTWNDPKYAARAKLNPKKLPKQTSYAFETAGIYAMRSGWGPDGVYMALHCAPPPLSGHDQPDNGNFELYAYGRWLMTDTGYYTYGHDADARRWHRQTRVHQTLTLDGRDTKIDGRLGLWNTSPELETLVVENPSYQGLTHRRTVWFVNREYFVILDEAIGEARGELRVHWTPAHGPGEIDSDGRSYATRFPDANVMIHSAWPPEAELEPEDGWFAWSYGKRMPRTMFTTRHPDSAPAAFLTVITPYRGLREPDVEASLDANFEVGSDEAVVSVHAFGKRWRLSRNLETKSAACQPIEEQAAVSTNVASVEIERLTALGSADHEDEFPAIGRDDRGNLWVAWVAFDGKADTVLAARMDDRKTSAPIQLSASSGDHWRPAMATDGQNRLWVTWARCAQGKWDIEAKYLAGGQWSEVMQLTRGGGNHFAQKLATGSEGTLWMAWQSVVKNNFDILLAPVTPEGLGTQMNVSSNEDSDWEPAIAAASDGTVYIAWDSYRDGSYDILLSKLVEGKLSHPVGIAATPAYEAHAALAVDREDRLWIAWDNGGDHWAEDNRHKLHSERSVEIRCLEKGVVFEPAEPLSVPLADELARFCELPELNVDGDGRLWLIVRHMDDVTPEHRPGKRRPQVRGIWNPYALCYDGNRWSRPVKLPDSNGRNDMRARTCLDSEGRIWAVWADDGRNPTRAEEPQNHNVHAARLRAPEPPVGSLALNDGMLDSTTLATFGDPEKASHYPKLITDEREYLLLYGDTHRHTDISRCGMNVDGSLMDTYRYAIDVAELDFLAITDHDQDILKHRYSRPQSPTQHYAWWRSEKYCDLFQIADRFITLYAYEHGGGLAQRGGHKNILYLERGQPCIEDDSPEALFAAMKGREAIAIPHQLADGPAACDWTQWREEFERVAEIYQARGSYEYHGAKPEVSVTREGHYFWDALAMGVKIGVIASSDHMSQRTAYAGVYSRDVTRAGIMEALKSRRTFGAMDKMVIEFRLGDHLLGQEIEIDAPPEFSVLIEAREPLRKVQIVKNGAFVHTLTPEEPTCCFDYVDQDIRPGEQAWYYVRCEQENDRYGWSSPIWIGWKPESDR